MKTVTLSLAKRKAVTRRALDAFSGKRRGAHISFASADLLWKVLTAKRWELLKAMTGRPWTTLFAVRGVRTSGSGSGSGRRRTRLRMHRAMCRPCALRPSSP